MKQNDKTRKEIISALHEIAKLKGIDEELLFTTLEDALSAAYRKNYSDTSPQDIKSIVDRKSGEIRILNLKKVVEETEDDASEISLEEAREKDPTIEPGDVWQEDVTPENFMRVAAQSAKQIVTQRIKEAERSIIYTEFAEKEFELISGLVQRKDKGNIYIDLGKLEAVLIPAEQIPGENLKFNERVQLYISEVKQNTKGPVITVSRANPGLVRRLFEREVPEIYDGTVEIKSISREPGSRTKIAVYSKDENVDATGACVGNKSQRVQNIVRELKNEKIDIIEWSKDPSEYIANSLSPARVKDVIITEGENSARVIVEDSQLSLAIGKEGQNVRLAARLTGWKIDIKSDQDPEAYNVPKKKEKEEEVKALEEAEFAGYSDEVTEEVSVPESQIPSETEPHLLNEEDEEAASEDTDDLAEEEIRKNVAEDLSGD